MTSTDSGVDTGNDSNDSYATSDTLSSVVDINPVKIATNLACSVGLLFPLTVVGCPAMNKPPTSIPGSSKSDDDMSPPITPKFEIPGKKVLQYSVSSNKDLEQPPAGLSFSNLQPLTFVFGNGLDILENSFDCTINTPYKNGELTRKLSSYRTQLEYSLNSILQIKKTLNERKLRLAVSTNNLERVCSLLESGVDPNCYDEQKRSPLHLATCRGYVHIIKALLAHGASPNQKDSLGNTPLPLAACTNRIEVVTVLLKAGTDVRCLDHFGRSPLQLAQSKLKLLQKSCSEDSLSVKKEVYLVVEMMKEFLYKRGQDTEAELMNLFSTRLTTSHTKEEVETDLKDLLTSLTNLHLEKVEKS